MGMEGKERKGKIRNTKKKILKENSMCFSSDKQKLKQNIIIRALGCWICYGSPPPLPWMGNPPSMDLSTSQEMLKLFFFFFFFFLFHPFQSGVPLFFPILILLFGQSLPVLVGNSFCIHWVCVCHPAQLPPPPRANYSMKGKIFYIHMYVLQTGVGVGLSPRSEPEYSKLPACPAHGISPPEV